MIRDTKKDICAHSREISATRWGIGHLFNLEVGVWMGAPIPEAVKKAVLV